MKKQYIKPAVNVMKVETEQIMAASNGGVITNGSNGSGNLNNGYADGDAMSKEHYSVWED